MTKQAWGIYDGRQGETRMGHHKRQNIQGNISIWEIPLWCKRKIRKIKASSTTTTLSYLRLFNATCFGFFS
jgi:hypothetical protein